VVIGAGGVNSSIHQDEFTDYHRLITCPAPTPCSANAILCDSQ
jgi:hypothetical protein